MPVAHSTARVQCRCPCRNRGTQHAHFATRIAASLSPMYSLAVSCRLQPSFTRALSLAHISIKVTVANRCDVSCCIHRLASPESSPLAPFQLVAPHSPSVLSRRPLLADGHAQLVLFLRELPQQSSSSSTYRLVSHWDYLMYGPALHTVITCATAPHSRNAQGLSLIHI